MTFFAVDITGRAYQSANTGNVDLSNYMKTSIAHATFVDEFGDTLKGDLDLNNHKIINIPNPINSQDVSNKEYVDKQVKEIIHNINKQFENGINMEHKKISNVGIPIDNNDAATKQYVDSIKNELQLKLSPYKQYGVILNIGSSFNSQKTTIFSFKLPSDNYKKLNINLQLTLDQETHEFNDDLFASIKQFKIKKLEKFSVLLIVVDTHTAKGTQ